MAHIYQPVMIRQLLILNGCAEDREIANALLLFDPSQLEYYQQITNNMVGKVLRNHQVVRKDKKLYFLEGFDQLTQGQIEELKLICEHKIDSYIQKRGDAIWNHRRNNRNAISGSIRYEVLKRAAFRCELCGISAQEKALEVDHIIPKSHRGEDTIHNYQALCYTCNASKRDRDATDFREQKYQYDCRERGCVFCQMDDQRIKDQNNLSFVIRDQYPVTEGHSLIIPKRHFSSYFDITQPELNAIHFLVQQTKEELQKEDKHITAFNIGINAGEDAGQTIMHLHIHLIPRRKSDVAHPVGGIRNIIPGMGDYLSKIL